uniref:Anoctamin n=1 Tax=Timema tahoe TaxID=61484 RepID=A0A7R9IPA0_9NEOP|nr:unnamed protein product [Timema tahoe]
MKLKAIKSERSEQLGVAADIDNTSDSYWDEINLEHQDNLPQSLHIYAEVPGTLFLELWKRYSADITHHWGLTGLDSQAEHPRPEYLARLANSKVTKLNVVTNMKEPYVPFWKVRVPKTILSFSVVLLLILIAIGAVFGVVLYRMSQLAAFSLTYGVDETSYMIMFIPITAALINLVCILLLNYLYDWLAVRLTEMELLRTQTEFEDSLTLKIYLFQFVNFYTSIFYIAFLKGKFVGYPSKYNRIFKYRQEEYSIGYTQIAQILAKRSVKSAKKCPQCWMIIGLNVVILVLKDSSCQKERHHFNLEAECLDILVCALGRTLNIFSNTSYYVNRCLIDYNQHQEAGIVFQSALMFQIVYTG